MVCPTIIAPSILPTNKQFDKGTTPSTYTVGLFTSSVEANPIQSYEVTGLPVTGITQPSCPTPDNSADCRTATIDVSKVTTSDYTFTFTAKTTYGGCSAATNQINYKINCPINLVIT